MTVEGVPEPNAVEDNNTGSFMMILAKTLVRKKAIGHFGLECRRLQG